MGTDCGPQWAQMPNLASRNQSGHLYCFSDSQLSWNGPSTGEALLLSVWAGGESAARTGIAHTPTMVNPAIKHSVVINLMTRFLLFS